MRRASQASGPLTGGISDLPVHLRATGQSADELNLTSNFARGLERRPPFVLEDYLNENDGPPATVVDLATASSAIVPYYDPTFDRLYFLVPQPATTPYLRAFEARTGDEVTCTVSTEAANYLSTGPLNYQTLAAAQLGKSLLLANRDVTVAKSGVAEADRPSEWLIYIRQGLDLQEYEVRFINSYAASDGSLTADRAETINTEEATAVTITFRPSGITGGLPEYASTRIAYELAKAIHNEFAAAVHAPGPNGNREANWRIVVEGIASDFPAYVNPGASVIKLRHTWDSANALAVPGGDPEFGNTGYDFYSNQKIKGGDGAGGSSLIVIGENIQDFEDLPPTGAWDNFTVRVTNSATSDDDYYVQYDSVEEVWVEVQKWGLDNTLDNETMPVQVTFNPATTTFTVDVVDWGTRQAGDENSSPDPPFVGEQIRDLAFVGERLAILTEDFVSFSETGEPFNYYPTSVISSSATDPFDLERPGQGEGAFRFLVGLDRGILVTARDANYLVSSAENRPLSGEESSLSFLHRVRANADVKPVVAGDLVFFPGDSTGAQHSKMYALLLRGNSVSAPIDISEQLDKRLPPSILRIWADENQKALVVQPLANVGAYPESDNLWVYRWAREGEEFTQSAWARWQNVMEGDLCGGGWHGSKLRLLQDRGAVEGNACLSLDFDNSPLTVSLPLGEVHLDFRHQGSVLSSGLTASYDAGADETTVTFPRPQAGHRGAKFVILTFDPGEPEHLTLRYEKDAEAGEGAYVVPGALGASDFFGYVYESKWTASEALAVSQSSADAQRPLPLRGGKLLLKRGSLAFEETAEFQVEVTRKGEATPRLYEFFASDASNAITPETGEFEFGIGGQASETTVVAKSVLWYPMRLSHYQWNGHHYGEGRRARERR